MDRDLIERQENAAMGFQFMVLDTLRNKQMTKAQLARRMGVTKGRVSQFFAPGFNPRLKTMVKILAALETDYKIAITRKTDCQ